MPPKVRIGLILQGASNWVGGAEYSKNLIKALYRLPDNQQANFELVLYSFGGQNELFTEMPERFFREVQACTSPPYPRWRRFAARFAPKLFGSPHASFLAQVRRQGIDFLFPYNPLPGDVLGVRGAAWIPDFQHKHLPQYFSPKELRTREKVHAHVAQQTSCLVVSSRSVEKDFQRFYPRQAHKSQVLSFHTAVEEEWFAREASAVADEYRLPERFFLVANQFWQHKNHLLVFRALGILRQQGIRPVLVCTGNLHDYRRPQYLEECRRLLQELHIAEQVHLLGLLPRSQQIQLCRRALAVIQPSLFEGWSTVVEDARALGKTLALSTIAVHHEQNPPHAVYCDPHQPEPLAALLKEWWLHLPPGPVREREEQARQHNGRQVQVYGQRFLDLAGGLVNKTVYTASGLN